MARECIENCPKIQECYENADAARGSSALLHVPTGAGTVDDLLTWCEASYDCTGPIATEVEVEKGHFAWKRTEIETQYICQHPNDYKVLD